jgi:energy-coupling factor transporter ATP-binding protein EcfA2
VELHIRGAVEDIVACVNVPDGTMRRVSVVGSTGSGKTTFARELAALLGVPHVELDALSWRPSWTMVPAPAFQARVAEATSGDAWVVDGNYGGQGAREIVWDRADTVVWLDFSLAVILARLFRRTNARIRSRVELWPGTGNRETFRGAYLSRGSLYVWALKTYPRRRRQYRALLALPQYARLRVLHFTRPLDADRWLAAQRSVTRASTQDAWPR